MIRYVCKYTPVELFAGFDEETALYNPMPENLDAADGLTHRNMCSYSRALLAARTGDDADVLILTDCCDSIRRAWDVLRSLDQPTEMLLLPRRQEECGREIYKNELLRLLRDWEKQTGKTFNCRAFRSAFNRLDALPEGHYVAVMGARLGDALLEDIRKKSPLPVRNNTCTGLRRLGVPPEVDDLEDLMDWYAGELLAQPACMRMTDLNSRRALTEDPNLRGVIYNTVNFCDFYGFEYATLHDRLNIPMVKIETDYTSQGAAQMSTRLGAFYEEIKELIKTHPVSIRQSRAGYYAGIDSGSTTTNAVILDQEKRIISSCTLLTGVQIVESAQQALEQALRKANLHHQQISSTVSTGYGRAGITFRDRDVTEITCHARGAHFLNPAVRTVIDIGGQDSKIILLNGDGSVRDFMMNDKCAAGTGRFLEMMAQSLGLTIEEMALRGLQARENITISSMCSVFAQSEVVSLIASGKRVEDIVQGLNRSVAAKVTALAGRRKLEREWMMTGGVARNPGVVAAVEERLGGNVLLPEEPEICGALGAALIALEESERG
ncbi:MAG TPA: 2-hydroxyglutaryl-CoA dehydratase [Anaerolineaceae bacterium]|uniref:CoA-substrate-specific enzyme activase, putative n=1 Tax=Anaerolinea thermophila TaxID=167964 RepID=A0A117LH26_9CHLR|nr:MAG: CoA-substrate-specific enzyme activase, putative [Anaerolinea thermophila]HAF62483.1 2-hydroxyglutaryl-CoA dehydratase [Anaerolineaceae bacterium]